MIASALLLFSLLARAEDASARLSAGAGLQYEEFIPQDDYKNETFRSLKGRVLRIEKKPLVNGVGNMVVATIGSEARPLRLLLAPDWFLKNSDFSLDIGDLIFIKGSEIAYNGEDYFIASEIKLRGARFPLREEGSGHPLWSEWRRGEEIFYKKWGGGYE